MKKILVVFDAHSYGGGELLFMRVCNYFLKMGYEVSVYGKEVENFFNKYGDNSIKKNIIYDLNNKKFDYIIISVIGINNIKLLGELKVESDKCIIWAFGESGFLENIFFGYGLRYRFSLNTGIIYAKFYKVFFFNRYRVALEFVEYLLKNKSLYFSQVDGITAAKDSEDYYFKELDLIIPIPIPILDDSKKINKKVIENNTLTIGWLGRVTFDFKVYSLIKAIEDSIQYTLDNNIRLVFIIIGDGDGLKYLIEYFKYRPVTLDVKGFMPTDIALKYLYENAELMIGMGTAALDAASQRLPSIVINASKSLKASRSCAYRWLHESIGYSLGEFVGFRNSRIQKNNSLKYLINDYLINRDDILDKTKNYLIHFSMPVVFNVLHNSLRSSNLTFYNLMDSYDIVYQKNIKIKNISNVVRRLFKKYIVLLMHTFKLIGK